MRLSLGAWWPEGRNSSSVSQSLPTCSWSVYSFFPNVPDISSRKCAFIREMNWHCATDRLNSLPVFQLCSRQFHFHVLITHTNKQLNRNFNWAACIWCLPPLLCISDVNDCSKHKLHIRTVAFPPPLTPRCPKRDASIANWAASGKANSRFFFCLSEHGTLKAFSDRSTFKSIHFPLFLPPPPKINKK